MRLPRPRFSVGYRIGDYKIIKIFMDKHIRYLCVYKNKWKEMFFEDDLIKLKGE